MNALQQLIADYLRDHPGETYASIGRRGGVSRQTVQSAATTERRKQSIHEHTIKALAKGMGLPEHRVHAAAGDAAGYRSGVPDEIDTPSALLMWEAYGQLDETRRRELEARARFLLDEQRSRGHGTRKAGK